MFPGGDFECNCRAFTFQNGSIIVVLISRPYLSVRIGRGGVRLRWIPMAELRIKLGLIGIREWDWIIANYVIYDYIFSEFNLTIP